jgi:hypothetical protein
MARGQVFFRMKLGDTGLQFYMSFLDPNSIMAKLAKVHGKSGPGRPSWPRIEQMLQRYYIAMAKELRNLVLEEQQKQYKRPESVRTGRLEVATADDRNITYDKSGFGVGVEAWLDKSDAKYWRQLEEGFTEHALSGREFYGMFGATLTGGWRRFASGRQPTAGQPLTYVGQEYRTGKFLPKSVMRAADRKKHFGGKHDGAHNTRMVIKKPIEAQDAYARAYYRFRKSNKAFWLFRNVVISELGLNSREVPRSYEGIVQKYF